MKYHRLTPQSSADLRRLLAVKTKTLGEILQEADLVSSWQIESALQDKLQYPELKIGEILARKEYIKPETADFFVRDWAKAVIESEKNALGYYLQQAAILNSEQIKIILAEQRRSGIRFGTVAVFQGFIKSTTLDYFLSNLYPEESRVSPFINMYSSASMF